MVIEVLFFKFIMNNSDVLDPSYYETKTYWFWNFSINVNNENFYIGLVSGDEMEKWIRIFKTMFYGQFITTSSTTPGKEVDLNKYNLKFKKNKS